MLSGNANRKLLVFGKLVLQNRKTKIPVLYPARARSCPVSYCHLEQEQGEQTGAGPCDTPANSLCLAILGGSFIHCFVTFWNHQKKPPKYLEHPMVQAPKLQCTDSAEYLILFLSHMPFAGLFDTSLVLVSEEPESPSLFIFSKSVMILYPSITSSFTLSALQAEESPLLNLSPHKSCSIPLILPVTLLCTNSAAFFGQGGDGNLVKTHPIFTEQHVGISPSNA